MFQQDMKKQDWVRLSGNRAQCSMLPACLFASNMAASPPMTNTDMLSLSSLTIWAARSALPYPP